MAYWKHVKDLESCLEYINRLGFGVPREHRHSGWNVYAQERLCMVEERLWQAASAYPFDTHYVRKDKVFKVRSAYTTKPVTVSVSDMI